MKGIRASRGFSSVLTSILMVGVVISIGISIWGFTHSAATVMRSDYYDEVMESVYKIKERFRIENIGVNITSAPSLQVWVVNYGACDINITRIRLSSGGNSTNYYPSNGALLSPHDFMRFDIVQSEVSIIKGLSLTVMVVSERENKAYGQIQIQ